MGDRVFALLIHDQPFSVEPLKLVLKDLSVVTYSIRTCREAERLLAQIQPILVFTDVSLSDGSWVDIFNLAEKAETPTNVIVVGPFPDMKLYVSVMERGAFDFIVPPFEREPIGFVVRSAELSAQSRKEGHWRAAVA